MRMKRRLLPGSGLGSYLWNCSDFGCVESRRNGEISNDADWNVAPPIVHPAANDVEVTPLLSVAQR